MGKIFAVTSGKGGVGKSTFSVGLGLAFANKGKNVLLVDMDEGLRCLDLMLGLDSKIVFDLSDILGGREMLDAVYKYDGAEGIFLVPAPAKTGLIDAFSLSQFVAQAKERFDIIIFDFPAGIDMTFYGVLPEDTLFLTVAVPDPVSIRDAAAISAELKRIFREARLVINRYQLKGKNKSSIRNIDDIIDSSSLRLLGIVPESDMMRQFSLKHKLKNRSRAAKAYMRIAARLEGEDCPLVKCKKI